MGSIGENEQVFPELKKKDLRTWKDEVRFLKDQDKNDDLAESFRAKS